MSTILIGIAGGTTKPDRSALTAFSRRAGLSSSVTMEMLLAPFARR